MVSLLKGLVFRMFQLLSGLSEPSIWVQGEKIGPAQVSRR